MDAAAEALIEDYFTVNDTRIEIPGETFTLVEPFCIEGPSVFKFELTATFSDE